MPLPGAQTPNTPAQLIQIVVCKYLHLHKHLCLTVCHGGNTSEASSLRKEMSLSLLTLPPLHIAQAPLHHPSAHKVSNTLYFQLVLCQRKEKQFQEEEAYLHVRCLLFAAPFYRSSFLPLAASQLPLPAGSCRCPPDQGCSSRPLSTRPPARPQAPPVPPHSVLSLLFNKCRPTGEGHGWTSGQSASAGLEKLRIEFL